MTASAFPESRQGAGAGNWARSVCAESDIATAPEAPRVTCPEAPTLAPEPSALKSRRLATPAFTESVKGCVVRAE